MYAEEMEVSTIPADIRESWNKLMKIKGVGLTAAQYTLSYIGSYKRIEQLGKAGNIKAFTRIPGIGTKTASKIITHFQLTNT